MYSSSATYAATIVLRATKFANEGEGAAWYASNEAVGLGRAVSSSFSFFYASCPCLPLTFVVTCSDNFNPCVRTRMLILAPWATDPASSHHVAW
jgi:hypothetical protein